MELRPAELLKEWRAGTFRPVYLFVGEEASARAEAVSQLKALFKADDFNLREFSGDPGAEAAAIVAEASTLPVFAERRLVIVSSPKIPAEARQTLAEYLKDPLRSTTLVLQLEDKKADPRDALVKAAAAGAVCVLGPLRVEEAESRLKALAAKSGKTLSDEAAAALVAEAGTEWAILKQELEKVLLFAKDESRIGAEAALQVLGYRQAADPFALSRLVRDRRLKEAVAHLRRFLRDGKPEEQAFGALGKIRATLSKQLRAKRMVSAGIPTEQVFRTLRLHPYWDRDYLSTLGKLGEARLRRDAKLCLETETDLKSKAWLDPALEVERLLVELCRP